MPPFALRTLGLLGAIAQLSLLHSAFGSPPPPRSIAWVLEMHEGIDHASQVRDLEAQIAAARAGGAKIICVEISGAPWRLDVAQSVGEVLAASEPPAIAFIRSDTGEAPLAFLVAGGRAGAGCWVQNETTLVSDAVGNVRELADSKSIAATESFWKKSDQQTRFSPYDALRAAMLDPSIGCWMISASGGKFEMRNGASAAADLPVITLSEPGAQVLRLKTQDAIALGLCSAAAPDARAALEAALARTDGSRPEMRERRPVGVSLVALRGRAESLLALADKSMDGAEPHLKLKVDSKEIAPNRKHEAALFAKPGLDGAANAIRETESILRADPEILRRPAPGQADTGQKAGQFETRWRSKLQQAKDRLEKLRAKADKLAGA